MAVDVVGAGLEDPPACSLGVPEGAVVKGVGLDAILGRGLSCGKKIVAAGEIGSPLPD